MNEKKKISKQYQAFIDQADNKNTKSNIRRFSEIGNYNFDNPSKTQIEELILKLNPISMREISTITTFLTSYAKFLDNDKLKDVVSSIDRQELWKRAKPNATPKFVSYKQFCNVIKKLNPEDPDEEFEQNTVYYRALFRAVYEGMYNSGLSILTNLRASDIHGTTLTLRPDDGESYDFEVSKELVKDLLMLADTHIWTRRSRYGGVCYVNIYGKYQDSCFKVETKHENANVLTGYLYKLRKVTQVYFDYKVQPKQLFFSGIMHRIVQQLKINNLDVNEVFSNNNRNRDAIQIIEGELKRCGLNYTSNQFKEIVRSNMEMFQE